MATTTTNYGLTKPGYGDAADIADINGNMDAIDDSLDAKDRSMAVVNTGDTAEDNIASGAFVYVRGHTTLADGLYKAAEAITSGASLTASNLTATSIASQLGSLFVVERKTLVDNQVIKKYIESGDIGQCRYVYSATRSDFIKPGYTIAGAVGIQYANASSSGHDHTFAAVQSFYINSDGAVHVKTINTHPGGDIKIRIYMYVLYIKTFV